MATKAELEQEVEQLKAQLASGQPPDTAAMTAELDQLKADLDSLADEKAQLLDQLQKVTESAQQGNALLDDSVKQIASLRQDLKVAQDALAAKPAAGPACVGNHASVDGKTYDILWRSTVKDLVYEGYHKRHVDENHTAIVVAKVGG